MMVLTEMKPSRSRMRGLRAAAGAKGEATPSSSDSALRSHGGGPFITGADSRFQAASVCSASPTLCVSYSVTRSRSGIGSRAADRGVAASAARTPSTARTTASMSEAAGAAMRTEGNAVRGASSFSSLVSRRLWRAVGVLVARPVVSLVRGATVLGGVAAAAALEGAYMRFLDRTAG